MDGGGQFVMEIGGRVDMSLLSQQNRLIYSQAV